MKKIISSLLLSLLSLVAIAGTGSEELWDRGNRLYVSGDYNGAIATYDSIVNSGLESAPLYYNLAGAYFKAGKNGKAILNYHRAERLDPSNEDIAHNLAYAEARVVDKIESVPGSAVGRWFDSIARLFSADSWGVVSLVMLGVALASLLFYLLSERRRVRKLGFFAGLVALVCLVLSVTFGLTARSEQLNDTEAIVLSTASSVKASPEKSGKDLFILHEGTKVEVLDSFGDWTEIRIADGKEGWILSSAIEVI
jgi:hypothetical protein